VWRIEAGADHGFRRVVGEQRRFREVGETDLAGGDLAADSVSTTAAAAVA
jgi:hypothetical protein